MSNILPNAGWEIKPTKNSTTVFGITYNCQQRNASICDISKTVQDEKGQDHKSNDSFLDLVILEEKLIADNLGLEMSNIIENDDIHVRSRQAVTVTVTQCLQQNYLRQEDYEAIFDGIIDMCHH